MLRFNRFPIFILTLCVSFSVGVALPGGSSLTERDDRPESSSDNDISLDSLSNGPAINGSSNFRSFQVDPNALSLKSAPHHIPSVSGLTLYSAPIEPIHLQNLLKTAQDDLAKRPHTDVTDRYQWNHSAWSFEVKVADSHTLAYGMLSRIVTRLLSLVPDPATTNITWTRVAIVSAGETPIADVATVPLEPDPTDPTGLQITNTTALELTAGNKIPVTHIDRYGSTSDLASVNSSALDIWGPDPNGKKKRFLDIHHEIFVEVQAMAWKLSIQLFNRNQTLVSVRAAVLMWAIYMGLTRMVLEDLGSVGQDVIRSIELNSGPVRFGKLLVRFSINLRDDYNIGYLKNGRDVLNALAEAIAEPLKREKEGKVYAVEGEVWVAVPVAGTNEQRLVGRWVLAAEESEVVHDEL